MNPIEFHEKAYVDMLNSKRERMCRVQVLGHRGFSVKGMFLGISPCLDKELTDMAGFVADVPIYKIAIMAEGERLTPMWINILLIEHINDIEFV